MGEPCGHHSVGVVKELVAGNQRDTRIDERGHVAHSEDGCTLDVEVLGEEHDAYPDDVDREDETHCELEGVPHEQRHSSRPEEAYYCEGVNVSLSVTGHED